MPITHIVLIKRNETDKKSILRELKKKGIINIIQAKLIIAAKKVLFIRFSKDLPLSYKY